MTVEEAWKFIESIDKGEIEKIEKKFGEIKIIIPVPSSCDTLKKVHNYIQKALSYGGSIRAFTEKKPFEDYYVWISLKSGYFEYGQVRISLG